MNCHSRLASTREWQWSGRRYMVKYDNNHWTVSPSSVSKEQHLEASALTGHMRHNLRQHDTLPITYFPQVGTCVHFFPL